MPDTTLLVRSPWSLTSPRSTNAERLVIYRAVREAGSVPEEAGFFLVAWLLDLMSDERGDVDLRESDQRLETIRQKYGLAGC